MTETSAAWQTSANWRKLEHFDAVLEVRNADKSIIYLPRQELSKKLIAPKNKGKNIY